MANGRCRCGAEMAGEVRFCGFCGAAARSEAAGLTPATVRALAGRGGDYYARKLGELFPSGTTSLKLSWYLYRRLYLPWLGFVALGFVLGHIHPVLCWLVPLGEGALGNALFLMALERRARDQAAAVAITSTAGPAS